MTLAHWLRMACAQVRHFLHLDPGTLPLPALARAMADAEWMKEELLSGMTMTLAPKAKPPRRG